MSEADIYALGFKAGIEQLWKIVQKIDREHPEYPIPFELDGRYRKLLGSVEDYLFENGGMNNGKDDIL